MTWIERRRRALGLETPQALAAALYRESCKRRPGRPMEISTRLIEILEDERDNAPPRRTHPAIADFICECLGATAAERDSIVAPKHRGGFKPSGRHKPLTRQDLQTQPARRPERKAPARAYNCRSVVKVDRFGYAVDLFPSVKVAADEAHIAPSAIRQRCCRRIVNEFSGSDHTYRYAEDCGSDGRYDVTQRAK